MRFLKIKNKGSQHLRLAVQIASLLLWIWIGIEFYFFVKYLETGGLSGSFHRPPGVDGFLPISSLMNLVYFFKTGQVHGVHPAGLFIFMGILAISLVFGKSFCSWFCSIGFLSEKLGNWGDKLTGRRLIIPRIPDYILRSIKYLLLSFLLFSILSMSAMELKMFLDGNYNIVADIRMYYFFAKISFVTFVVIFVLMLISVFIRGFWCRYLCPYGALLGFTGLLSPNKIVRNETSCISCGKCTKVCPSFIKVDKVKRVVSDECTSCLQCVDVCPVKDTLNMQTPAKKMKISGKMVAILVVLLFMLITGLAIVFGKWQNNIPESKYKELFKIQDTLKHLN
jgi:polyferredoxin